MRIRNIRMESVASLMQNINIPSKMFVRRVSRARVSRVRDWDTYLCHRPRIMRAIVPPLA